MSEEHLTSASRVRLRQLGQLDLGAHVEIADKAHLWTVQHKIAAALSKYRARVAVPSCTASGKSWSAGRLALSFYDTFTPGTPCRICKGPCAGAKVITISSKFEQLRDVLWGEIRLAYGLRTDAGLAPPGTMSQGQNLRLQAAPNQYMVGMSPAKAEALQGVHGGHILVLGDEATALSEEVTKGLVSTLATGDARMLLLANPTTDDTWFAQQCKNPITEVIKIRAWDTPNFTGEDEIPGLLTPAFLEEMKGNGQGPGTFDWTTKVEADFWSHGEDALITPEIWDGAEKVEPLPGVRALGVDLAPYGSDENVICYRDGNSIVRLDSFHSMRPDLFFEGPVTEAVRRFAPDYLQWDADGVGSGVYGDVDRVLNRYNAGGGNCVALPFRGAIGVDGRFRNARSMWHWNVRQLLEQGALHLGPTVMADRKLREQALAIQYSITEAGDIRIETKEQMRKRGSESPDRFDSIVYALALSDHLPTPGRREAYGPATHFGAKDHSEAAMWDRTKRQIRERGKPKPRDPWARRPDGAVWDDL